MKIVMMQTVKPILFLAVGLMLGSSLHLHAQQVTQVDTIRIMLFTDSVGLEEVTVRTHKKPAANSRFSDMLPVVVTPPLCSAASTSPRVGRRWSMAMLYPLCCRWRPRIRAP